MNSFFVPEEEVEAVQVMLDDVAPQAGPPLREARTHANIEPDAAPEARMVELKCSDQFLEIVWTALKDHSAELPADASYNGIPVTDLIEHVEAWMIKWSESNQGESNQAAA